MARQHEVDEESLRAAAVSSSREVGGAEQAQVVPEMLPGSAAADLQMRTGLMLSAQQGAGNQAVQQRMGAEGGELGPDLSSKLQAGRSGGQPIEAAARADLESGMETDLESVRIHTDSTADSLSRQLSAKAFTSGSDIFFRSGAYDPESGAGRDLLGHEVAHVVQQGGRAASGPLTVAPAHSEHETHADTASGHVGHGRKAAAGPALSGALIARKTDADELDEAGDKAAKEDTLSKAASNVTNVGDLNAAVAAKARVEEGSAWLETGRQNTMAGAEVTPAHEAANAGVIQKLDFYIGFAGEETRTGVDFIDRYRKAHADFARLDAMAVQYEQMTGQSASKSTDLLSAETGATSGADAAAKFGGLRGLPGDVTAGVTAARGALTATENTMRPVKNDIGTASAQARIGFQEVITATEDVNKAAADNKVKEKTEEVAKVKADIAALQGWISKGIDVGLAVGTAGVTSGAAAFGAVPASQGTGAAASAAVSAGSDAAVMKGKDLAFDKAKEVGKDAATGFSEFVATKTYEQELRRADAGLAIAANLSAGLAAEIGGNRIRTAIEKWKVNLQILRDKSAEFDALQATMEQQIRAVGEAMEAAGMGKQEGARFTVIAEFRSAATSFVNDADVTLKLGAQYREAMQEASARRGKAAYTKEDTSPVWYDTYKGYDGRYRLRMNYLNLGIRQAAGEGGSIETADFMLKELEAYRNNAERYRSDMAKAMGGTA
ncbi:DUF4157 domain-containing protein [Kribbella sp. NPDC058245]|uniref:eCIS core domain-containing protein n=1 Tax=Kribbella sp. NPDC058245 TaxID=3346399 RepID=UPI0036EE1764